jgi:hypothetical protein
MIRVTGLLTLVMIACLSNGCSVGITAAKYPPAQGPSGVIVRVKTAQGDVSGELIEVRDAGIVVLANQKLRLLPYTVIVSSEVDRTDSGYAISQRTVPRPAVQAHLRLLSRFPQGLAPDLMRQLLDTYGQTELAGANP